jgi:branched-subunit amino acid transport protein
LNIYMLLVTCGLVLATFATRTVMLLGRQRFKPSRHIDAALRYAPVCALAVLVVPEVLLHAGAVDVSVTNPRLAGAGCVGLRSLEPQHRRLHRRRHDGVRRGSLRLVGRATVNLHCETHCGIVARLPAAE